ncbi:MAG: cell wall-active antibiotics response protein [Clostridiales bacterium]|nr:cell wall-active antibiotics response protein [Clostridiales bacterium]
MSNNKTKVFFGLAILGIAVLMVLKAFDVFSSPIFDGWWALIFILPALASMISSKPNFGNIILLGFGIWLWLKNQSIFEISENLKIDYLVFAIVIACCGLWLVFGRNNIPKFEPYQNNGTDQTVNADGEVSNVNVNYDTTNSTEDRPSYFAFFGGTKVKNNSLNLQKADIISVFGGSEIDFSSARVAGNNVRISVISIFGGSDIIPPENVNVKMSGLPIFGGASDKRRNIPQDDPTKPTVYIDYVSIFGGMDIK